MSPEGKWPWSVLGLDAMPSDAKDIRRAYARALKQIDQATDIEGFSKLRATYENAIALREGRTARNDHTRARKAEAKVVQKAADAQETESAAIQPPSPLPSFEPPAPPQPTPEELAATARAQELETLLTFLATDTIVMSGGARINQALDNPLSRDPDHADAIPFAIVQVIRSRFRQSSEEAVLSPQIDRDTMLRLNDTYGWLSDFGAFRRDFWNNTNLLDAMATRAYGSIRVATPPPLPPKTKAGRAWLWAKTHATLLTVCYIGVIVAASAVADDGPAGSLVFNVLIWVIVLPIALAVPATIFIVLNGAFNLLRGVWGRSLWLRSRFGPKK
ncbi:hypothetical protein [Pseudorhodobacter ferrugineus]|uniref:hypothetical protein n=1 Tax=Pseudorhodobacter ferrugineus TaxID=77008 RepID=UPI0003B73EE7|nr:hypothetical protein [Pseudorhodobacter ferrugineus]